MLYREFPPNAHLWNGLGGKIEVDETPLASVQREIREEAGIDLLESPSLFFAGITTWEMPQSASIREMYTFIAQLSKADNIREKYLFRSGLGSAAFSPLRLLKIVGRLRKCYCNNTSTY